MRPKKPYKHFYSKTGDVSYTGFFIPSYTLWYGDQDNPGYDSRGVVDEERAKKYYENQWSKIASILSDQISNINLKSNHEFCKDFIVLEVQGTPAKEGLEKQKRYLSL